MGLVRLYGSGTASEFHRILTQNGLIVKSVGKTDLRLRAMGASILVISDSYGINPG